MLPILPAISLEGTVAKNPKRISPECSNPEFLKSGCVESSNKSNPEIS